MIRTIIVEDEFHPRQTLQQKLAGYHPDIEILLSCENAETALFEILHLQPDLIFLDIQLPDKNGLWLADQLQLMACESFKPPGIIFTTAYSDSEYLINAIRLTAIDYLVKPIMIDSLSLAIARFRKRADASQDARTLKNVVRNEKMLSFKNVGGLLLLKVDDIAYIEADGNYACMWLANGDSETIFERLGEMEKNLPPDKFLRAGKSIIINRQYIRQIHVRKSTVQLATPFTTYTVEVSAVALKQLKENY
jgi:two-component system LytT family response regulator